MVEAIQQAEGMKVYVCNVMTEDGETEGYTVSDHIRALFRHSAEGLFGLCLTNSASIPGSWPSGMQKKTADRCSAMRLPAGSWAWN